MDNLLGQISSKLYITKPKETSSSVPSPQKQVGPDLQRAGAVPSREGPPDRPDPTNATRRALPLRYQRRAAGPSRSQRRRTRAVARHTRRRRRERARRTTTAAATRRAWMSRQRCASARTLRPMPSAPSLRSRHAWGSDSTARRRPTRRRSMKRTSRT
ncbi:MAG: hypothetical protein J3K34DRAFT_422513 [Monoraphidium minutum]|nr:MAG: hypothetical protein J3K34DRAFT_422513 [Monoraphidium minutum]